MQTFSTPLDLDTEVKFSRLVYTSVLPEKEVLTQEGLAYLIDQYVLMPYSLEIGGSPVVTLGVNLTSIFQDETVEFKDIRFPQWEDLPNMLRAYWLNKEFGVALWAIKHYKEKVTPTFRELLIRKGLWKEEFEVNG